MFCFWKKIFFSTIPDYQAVEMELLRLLKDPMFNLRGEMNRLTNCCSWTGRSVLLQIYTKTNKYIDTHFNLIHASLIIKEILLKIRFIEEIRTTWLMKRCPSFFPRFPLFAKIRFNPFDSIPLATMHFAIL